MLLLHGAAAPPYPMPWAPDPSPPPPWAPEPSPPFVTPPPPPPRPPPPRRPPPPAPHPPPPDAPSPPPVCESDHGTSEGDESYADCKRWCNAASASWQCTWCHCKSCSFCAPPSPSPPPPPPHPSPPPTIHSPPPPPPPWCSLGAVYEVTHEGWALMGGGFDAAVQIDQWAEGVMVSLHFDDDLSVTATHHAHYLGAADGLLTFALHKTPPGSAFSFHVEGSAVYPDHISCTGPFFASPSPPPPDPPHMPAPPPAIPPTGCILQPHYSLSPSAATGFSARVQFARYQPGAIVSLHFGPRAIAAPAAVYGAVLLEHSDKTVWKLSLASTHNQVVIVASARRARHHGSPATRVCRPRRRRRPHPHFHPRLRRPRRLHLTRLDSCCRPGHRRGRHHHLGRHPRRSSSRRPPTSGRTRHRVTPSPSHGRLLPAMARLQQSGTRSRQRRSTDQTS